VTKPLRMPAGDGVRVHNDQRGSPVVPGVGQQYPEQSVSSMEGRPPDRAFEHRQLLAKRQVLKRDRAMSAADQCQRPKQKEKCSQYESSCRLVDTQINRHDRRSCPC
jgi:hypothetical protein